MSWHRLCKESRVTNNMSLATQGNQVLGMIRRYITYKDKSLIVPLYKAIVRSHLEYFIQTWSPYLRKDMRERGEQQKSFQD